MISFSADLKSAGIAEVDDGDFIARASWVTVLQPPLENTWSKIVASGVDCNILVIVFLAGVRFASMG